MIGASMIGFDITDRKLAEERAAIAVDQRDKFLALLSHELRNPLMALMSANELLLRSDKPDVTSRARQVISRQISQMSRLLEDTFDASRMRHDEIELHRKKVDVRVVVEAALDVTRQRAESESITLGIDLPAEAVYMKVDGPRLQQVIVNLMHNAINHSAAGQIVTMSLQVEHEHAVLRVSDEGVGISPEALPKLFEPFFQASRRSKNGMGLGLSLARSIVRAHGGEIRAASDGLGRGAAFEVRLPLIEDSKEALSALPAVTHGHRADQPAILLIDDDEASRESIAALLRDSGYEVHEARDGTGGLRLIEEVVPSVVVLDVGLPDISGLEIARTVRSKYGWKAIRLVALTGFGRQADREAAIEAGCDMHLVKPIDFSTLEKVVAYQASR